MCDKSDTKAKPEKGLIKAEANIVAKNSIEAGKAAVGALIGLVIGGPAGAVVGAITAPVITIAQDITQKVIERKRLRLERIVEDALDISKMDLENVLLELSEDDTKVDDFLSLLSIAVDSDPSLDSVFKGLVSEMIKCHNNQQKDRLLIIGDAVKNFRSIHLRILKALFYANGVLKASEIADAVKVPEIELRSVVRDLELRGMIKDLEKIPIEWELRELGQAVAMFVCKTEEELL